MTAPAVQPGIGGIVFDADRRVLRQELGAARRRQLSCLAATPVTNREWFRGP